MPMDAPTLASRTGHVAAALFLMTAAFVLVKTGRDALYFQDGGLYDLPLAYVGIAVLSVPTAFLMLSLMRRLGPRRARVLAPLGVAGALLGFSGVVRPGGGLLMTAFFVLVPLAFGVLFSASWLLAADLLAGAPRPQMAHAYSRVGAASILGGVAGGLLARMLAPRIEVSALLVLAAAALAASVAVTARAQNRFPPAARPGPGTGSAPVDFRTVLKQRYPVLLLVVGMTASLVGVLVEFQLYLVAATAGNRGRENASFFAGVYVVLNGAALIVQLYVMPWLQRTLGVSGSLHVLPALLVGGAAGVLASASLFSRSLLRVVEGGLKASIHRVNWEQAYLPLDGSHRPAAKILVDGMGARIAEGLAALLLFLWVRLAVAGGVPLERRASWLGYALFAASLVWVALTRALVRDLAPAAAPEAFRLDVPPPDS